MQTRPPWPRAIGGKVRHERQSRRWTLDQLADAAGVSRRMVVNVEQGTANPSVGTLLRISDALGIGLPALVEPPETDAGEGHASGHGGGAVDGLGRRTRGAGRRDPASRRRGAVGLDPGGGGPARERGPRAGHQGAPARPCQGKVALEVAGESTTLSVGDAASFPGDVPHAYGNVGRGMARFSLSVFEPGVGPAQPPEGR